MLVEKKRRKLFSGSHIIIAVAIVLVCGGMYIVSLLVAPAIAPFISMKPINVASLPAPVLTDDRIIIPKIGVDIAYGKGPVALDRGAEWRYPDRGNPQDGGNFIIAAHRLSIQPTPGATIEKSPFYNIDRMNVGDQVIIDYKGGRYTYKITTIKNVTPTQTEIEAPSLTPKLTLYSCELSGAASGRVVLIAALVDNANTHS